MIIGFIALVLQLIITAFYIDKIPIFISIFNFLLLLCLLISSIYTFSRVISLETTKQNLQIAEEYNKSLNILYDEVKGFNHDFKNIISTIDGYVDTNDIDRLRKFLEEVKEDCMITKNLSILNPRVINNPGIYSLLNNKYFKATNAGIKFDLDFLLDLDTLQVNNYKFSRILGVLLDNAIESVKRLNDKKLSINILMRYHRDKLIIKVVNPCNINANSNFNCDKVSSSKGKRYGIGLRSIKDKVLLYKGYYNFEIRDSNFHAVIVLPMNQMSYKF